LGLHNEEVYTISFDKITEIYPNIQEIDFINDYRFDDEVLQILTTYLNKNENSKLKMVRFLYYDYKDEKRPSKPLQDLNNGFGWKKKYLNKEWEIKEQTMGKAGYQVKVFKPSNSLKASF
ncbi:MAG: hypothetical protein AAF335_04150, partial [Bacteroidota bacterium]